MLPTSDVVFTCDCPLSGRQACMSLPFFRQVDDKRYCVLHCPITDKLTEFAAALDAKLVQRDDYFDSVWFPPNVDLSEREFSTEARFSNAVFAGDVFFRESVFRDAADFSKAEFRGSAYFDGATFSAVHFLHARFAGAADFIGCKFNAVAIFVSASFQDDADFTSALFKEIGNFDAATFARRVLFVNSTHGRKSTLVFPSARFGDVALFQNLTVHGPLPFDFRTATFEQPDRVTFQSVLARPLWFLHTDPRKFHFINVTWLEGLSGVRRYKYSPGVDAALREEQLLAVAYRRLAANAEENGRYSEAASFRYEAMHMRTRELQHAFWRAVLTAAPTLRMNALRARVRLRRAVRRSSRTVYTRGGKYQALQQIREAIQGFDPLHRLYGLSSGYGERAGRALLVLLLIWMLFATAYAAGDRDWWQYRTGQQHSSQPDRTYPTSFGDALIYSAGVLTLQKPDPAPARSTARALVLLETILGPLQATFFALAVRRKFMRM